MNAWRDFWDGDTPIYVSERHRELHYDGIAADLCALVRECSPGARPVMVDYGCGEARHADRVAALCERLYLVDAAPSVTRTLRQRFAACPAITVLDEGIGAAHAQIPPQSVDLIVANSVIQYLADDEFAALLARWRMELRPGGALVLADLIPPGSGAWRDVAALLHFGRKGGFALAACIGLLRTAVSDYSRVRRAAGLACHELRAIRATLAAAGFADLRMRPNLGHNPHRYCVVAW